MRTVLSRRRISLKILFVHQNMPGQFKHLAPFIARDGRHEVVFLTKRQNIDLPGVRKILYEAPRAAHSSTHHYVRLFENSVLHGQQVVRSAQKLRQEGFIPDLIVAHPGWGESLFIKDVFPASPLLSYSEYYYQSYGGDVGFDPSDPPNLDVFCRLRSRDAHLLLSLDAADRCWSPTEWQKSRHPGAYLDKIEVVFDGIDTREVKPNPDAIFTLPDGRALTRADEVITYVARNLEPYRGFPTFMRALARLQRLRPHAHVIVVGGDGVSYGSSPKGGLTWREQMETEVEYDRTRVLFVGQIPYSQYLNLLQISRVHLYLTVPFVLSWSFMEAMAAGCVVVGSKTAPVEEVLEHGVNGFFTDFFDPEQVASDVAQALDHPDRERIRAAARETVVDRYDLAKCLPRQLQLLQQTAEMKPALVARLSSLIARSHPTATAAGPATLARAEPLARAPSPVARIKPPKRPPLPRGNR